VCGRGTSFVVCFASGFAAPCFAVGGCVPGWLEQKSGASHMRFTPALEARGVVVVVVVVEAMVEEDSGL